MYKISKSQYSLRFSNKYVIEMLPGDQVFYLEMYLAEELTFQFHRLTQFIYVHVYTKI